MSAPTLDDKRRLLAMMGGAAPPKLDGGRWAAIDAMARQHRLQPMLAWRLERAGAPWTVPAALAEDWREAREAGRLLNLALLAGLRTAAEALEGAGIAFTVLKGPRLAWRGYPEAALRPMRDLDVLVAESDVLAAEQVLCKAGFEADRSEATAAEALAQHRHLPALWHPGLQLKLELHHRLSDPPARHGYRVPQLDPAAMLETSETIDLSGVATPCPTPGDLLAHLMVHALYGHRLDCGPLVLADIHFLLARETVDSQALTHRAEAGGWLRGAALLLALTERYFGSQPLVLGDVTPEGMLATAEDLLLQDLDARDQSIVLADLMAARSTGALVAAVLRRLTPETHVVEGEGRGAPLWRFWPVWAARRVGRLIRHTVNRRANREASRAAALLRWLQG